MSDVSSYRECRRNLFEHGALRIEAARAHAASGFRSPLAFTSTPQFIIPLWGAFIYERGSVRSLVTANEVLLIAAGDESRDRFVDARPLDYLIMTLGDEIFKPSRFESGTRSIGSPLWLQRAASTFWSLCARDCWTDASERMESSLTLMTLAIATAGTASSTSGPNPGRLVRKVKDLIGAGGLRLSLTEIAEQVKASPNYLTAAFRRCEGITIARYQRRLRLSRALHELPRADDLAALALDLGFSSHAHFSSAFSAAFGESPSQYRHRIRSGVWRAGQKA